MTVLNTGVFTYTEVLGQDATGTAIEIGKYKDVTVQLVRTGSTITATVQVSNDGDTWVTAHSRRIDTNDHVALATLAGGVETLLERARFVRALTSDVDESFEFIVSAPSARG